MVPRVKLPTSYMRGMLELGRAAMPVSRLSKSHTAMGEGSIMLAQQCYFLSGVWWGAGAAWFWATLATF